MTALDAAQHDPAGETPSRARDLLDTYLAQAKKHPLLTAQQELELAQRFADTGDLKARERLVTANLRLVVKCVYAHRCPENKRLDIIQEGNIGLMKAIDRFDPARGTRLSTYAMWWIRAHVLKAILRLHGIVKIGTTVAERRLFYGLRKTQARLRARGIEVTPERVAQELDVTTQAVREMENRASTPVRSLDTPLSTDAGQHATHLDLLTDRSPSPAEALEHDQWQTRAHAALHEFAGTLRGRQRELYEERLLAERPLTLRELGERWGVSAERARQLEVRLQGPVREFVQARLASAPPQVVRCNEPFPVRGTLH